MINNRCTFSNTVERSIIIIDKNGLRVAGKNPTHQRDDDIIRTFLIECIDMDGWKHSWHMDVGKAHSRRSKERKEVRRILLDKIKDRKSEIKKLKDAIQILGRWHW
jgi:hypothetical protein